MDGSDCIIAKFVRKDNADIEAYRLFRVKHTVFEMLRDRGYAVTDGDLSGDFEKFRLSCGDPPDYRSLTTIRAHPSAGKIIVFFFGEDSFKIAHLRDKILLCNKEGATRMIITYKNSLTSLVRKAVRESQSTIKIELFHMADFLTNPTHHVLMPKHEILTADEKEQILKHYSIKENQMPRMLQTDSVARYYALEPGQVVKVTYDDGLTKSHFTYRCVV